MGSVESRRPTCLVTITFVSAFSAVHVQQSPAVSGSAEAIALDKKAEDLNALRQGWFAQLG
jgi:hypothetical protein